MMDNGEEFLQQRAAVLEMREQDEIKKLWRENPVLTEEELKELEDVRAKLDPELFKKMKYGVWKY